MADQATTTRHGYTDLAGASEYLDCSPRTVRRMIAIGVLPAYRVGGRLLRVRLADLDAATRRIPTVGGAA